MSKQALQEWYSKRDLTSLAAALVGLIFGLWFLGPRNILPGTTGWLNRGDLAAYQVTSEFFRDTPLLQWPLTAIRQYGVGWQTMSVSIYGESLIGIPLKLFNGILPRNFQYIGIWIVSCFVLQGYFAGKLLSLFVSNANQIFLGSLIFVFSPTLLYRIGIAGHSGLGAHWIILCALYLYFRKRQSAIAWSALIFVAISVHFYIFAMVFLIFLAAVVKVLFYRSDERKLQRFWNLVLWPLLVTAVSFFALGYWEIRNSAVGVGFFRLNVLAFFNPRFSAQDSFSFLLSHFGPLRARPLVAEEGEGFQYLGLGAILTVPFLVVYIARNRAAILWKRLFPVLLACIFLFLVALSNHVVFIRHEFVYPLPESILNLRQVFRAATRFAWPLYYLLTLAGIVATVRLARRFRTATILVLVLVSVHFFDQLPGLVLAQHALSTEYPYQSPLIDPAWNEIGSSYRKINLVPTFDLQSNDLSHDASIWVESGNWLDLVRFAAKNGLATNFAYVGRPVTKYVSRDNAKMTREIASGELETNTVYVFSNIEFWNIARNQLRDGSRAIVLNGFYIILSPLSSD
jgi:hypothetical protein